MTVMKYWDGSAWVPTGTIYDAGTGITLTGTTFSSNDSEIDHNQLSNYDIAEHRIINDAGTATDELWSSNKINTELDNKVDVAGDTMTGGLTLVAGTTTVAPLKMVAGTNLTTPTAGVFEYDGTDLFFTIG